MDLDPKDIQETVLLNTNLRKETENEKLGILDVRVKMHDNTQIDLEMQVLPFQFWEERTLYYACKMYTDQIVSGDNYDVLVKCIQISILDFAFLKDTDQWYSCFHLREDRRGSLYSDKLEFHVLELPKLGKWEEPENELLQWAKFLNGKREEDFKEMAEKNEYINEAYISNVIIFFICFQQWQLLQKLQQLPLFNRACLKINDYSASIIFL